MNQLVEDLVEKHVPKRAYAEQWDIPGLDKAVKESVLMELPLQKWADEEGIADEELEKRIREATDTAHTQLTQSLNKESLALVEKQILLRVIDKNWREHLQQLDALKSVIGMRAYGQRDPLNEYKSEAFTLFDGLLTSLRQDVTKEMMGSLLNAEMQRQQQTQQSDQVKQQLDQARAGLANIKAQGQSPQGHTQGQMAPPPQSRAPRSPMDMVNQGGPIAAAQSAGLPADALKGVSRNSPCPCGSGLKVKQCHGKIT